MTFSARTDKSLQQQSFSVVNRLVQLQDRVRIVGTLEDNRLALQELSVLVDRVEQFVEGILSIQDRLPNSFFNQSTR